MEPIMLNPSLATATPAGLAEPIQQAAPPATLSSSSFWLVVLRQLRQDPVAMTAALVLLIIVGAAVFAPWLAPADPYKASMLNRL